MTLDSHRKGRKAELELSAVIADLTGWPVTPRLQEGRRVDAGDLVGLPDCCAQVKNTARPLDAETDALRELPAQREASGCTFAAAFIRHRGGRWVVAMDLPMFCTLLREATAP